MVARNGQPTAGHMDPLRDETFASYMTRLIAHLRGEVGKVPMVEEPLAETSEEDGVFDIWPDCPS